MVMIFVFERVIGQMSARVIISFDHIVMPFPPFTNQ
jgi:hypothetical protein